VFNTCTPFAFFHPSLGSVDDTTEPYSATYRLHHYEKNGVSDIDIPAEMRDYGDGVLRYVLFFLLLVVAIFLRVERFLGYFARSERNLSGRVGEQRVCSSLQYPPPPARQHSYQLSLGVEVIRNVRLGE